MTPGQNAPPKRAPRPSLASAIVLSRGQPERGCGCAAPSAAPSNDGLGEDGTTPTTPESEPQREQGQPTSERPPPALKAGASLGWPRSYRDAG